MKIGEIRYRKGYREKCISINGIKVIVILPKSMKPKDLENRIITKKNDI